jgi:hypothetical protein
VGNTACRGHIGPGDFAQRLVFCSWLNVNRRLHRYILCTDEAQFHHDGVHNTILLCGQMGFLTSSWKEVFNYVLVSVCSVQFWMIKPMVFSSSKVVLQEL